jgi:Kef-type K+ transport system membrane component KefB
MIQDIPVLTSFAIAMVLIVLMPRLMERVKLPAVLGFMIAGIIVGPAGLGIVKQDGPIIGPILTERYAAKLQPKPDTLAV